MTSNEAVQAGPTIPDTMRAAVLRDHDKGLEIETIRTYPAFPGELGLFFHCLLLDWEEILQIRD